MVEVVTMAIPGTVIGYATTGIDSDTVTMDTGHTITESGIGDATTGPGDGSAATGPGSVMGISNDKDKN